MVRTLLMEREERTVVTGTRGKGSKQLLNDPKEARGYWNLERKHVENSLWKMLWTYCETDSGMNVSYISVLTRIKSIDTCMN